jgi:hypothetical protein
MATQKPHDALLLVPGEEGFCLPSEVSLRPTHLTIIIIGPFGG